MEKGNVICIKREEAYPAAGANMLYFGIRRHTSRDVAFHCFTDHASGRDKDFIE